MSQIRLDKWLADAGVGTRSQVKEYLKKGRVRVNGEPVKNRDQDLGETDEVSFDGEIFGAGRAFAWYMFHKPAGCITAARNGRTETVMDYFAEAPEKELAPVGRLDKDTEGFLLITNDGPLNHFLLAPGRHVEKTYYAKAEGTLFPEAEKRFLEGLDIGDDKPTLPTKLEILKQEGNEVELLLTLREGRFHQVKRMVEAAGAEVTYLKRISFGGLPLDGTLEKGGYRPLTEEEVRFLATGRHERRII